MKKILWVINPLDFKESDCEFPFYIASLIDGEVTVGFIDTGQFENIPLISDSSVFPTRDFRTWNASVEINEEKLLLAESVHVMIRGFFSARNKMVHFQEEAGITQEEVLKESRFSDLLLVNISLDILESRNAHLSSLVKELLIYSRCPVLIIPENLKEIESIYFTFDNSDSSIYAIKQFTYLFENLKEVPVTVLSVIESDSDEELPEKKRLTQYLSGHYRSWNFHILRGRPENELLIELMYRQNAIVTFGAFGRNRVSRMLHPGDSERVTERIDIPVFITHP